MKLKHIGGRIHPEVAKEFDEYIAINKKHDPRLRKGEVLEQAIREYLNKKHKPADK